MANAGEQRDELIRFQAQTEIRMANIEAKQECHQDQIDDIVRTQTEFKVSLGKLTLQATIGSVIAGGLATGLWTFIQHLIK